MAQRNPSRPLPLVKNQFRPASDWVGHISDVTTCPFNSVHVMRSHKLISHLPKCEKKDAQLRKANEEEATTSQQKMGTCPYNSFHVYPADKQGEHFQECRARREELMARYLSGESIKDMDRRYSFKDKDNL